MHNTTKSFWMACSWCGRQLIGALGGGQTHFPCPTVQKSADHSSGHACNTVLPSLALHCNDVTEPAEQKEAERCENGKQQLTAPSMQHLTEPNGHHRVLSYVQWADTLLANGGTSWCIRHSTEKCLGSKPYNNCICCTR
jgi:hypothetical protein